MKKIAILFSVIIFFGFLTTNVSAATIPTVPERIAGPSGCTGFETSSSCRPEWAESMSKCISGTYTPSSNLCQTLSPDDSSTNVYFSVCSEANQSGRCRPERVNPYAPTTIARQAETMGQSVGYNISCNPERVNITYLDYTTGLNYFMQTFCTVNGLAGVSAEDLVNVPSSWNTLESNLSKKNTSLGNTTIPLATTNSSATGVSSPSINYGASLVNLLNQVTTDLRTQVGVIQNKPITTSQAASTKEYTTSLNTLVNKMIADLKNQLELIKAGAGMYTGGTGTTPVVTTPVSSDITILDTPGTLTFRYMRLDTSKDGWVSWREIEAYNKSNNKVSPTKIDASCNWCNYGTPDSLQASPNNVNDGNLYTAWNAGETSPCTSFGCDTSRTRKAWIQIDYGSITDFSKIKAMHNGDTINETTRVLVSNDGKNFSVLTNFNSPMGDMDWMEYPVPVTTAIPSVAIEMIGPGYTGAPVKDTTAVPYQAISFSYKAKDADYLTFEESAVLDNQAKTLLTDYICSQPTIAKELKYSIVGSGYIKKDALKTIYINHCMVGRDITVTLNAHQRDGTKTSTSAVIRIDAQPDKVDKTTYTPFVASINSLPKDSAGRDIVTVRPGTTVFFPLALSFPRTYAINIGTDLEPNVIIPPLDLSNLSIKTISAPPSFKITFDPLVADALLSWQTRPETGTSRMKVEIPANTIPGIYPIEIESRTSTGDSYRANVLITVSP